MMCQSASPSPVSVSQCLHGQSDECPKPVSNHTTSKSNTVIHAHTHVLQCQNGVVKSVPILAG